MHTRSPISTRLAAPLLVALLGLGGLGGAACQDDEPFARAYRATSPDQLIGGDVAMARLGDFILENDKIRIAILDKDSSPAPGVFGGTLVDADLQRPESIYRNGNGHDQLAEIFPVVNLFFPRPDTGDVRIISDGSGGGPAILRVSGEGGLFLEALSLLTDELQLFPGVSIRLKDIFPGVKVDLRIETDYILEPGAQYVRMSSRIIWTEPDRPASEDALPLRALTEPTAIFRSFLGDDADQLAPGILAGDFVFFGAQNDLFAPGIGFDEEKPIFDALFQGRDTFTFPLAFDFMAAAGGNVSYGYFSVGDEGAPPPKVLVPIVTSSSTGFVTHAVNCSTTAEDDETCDRFTQWTWDRYLAVGHGDVASVADVIHARRGTAVGTLAGVVRGDNGQALPKAKVFVLRDPDPQRAWRDVYEVADQNYRDVGTPGVLNAIDADVGTDPVLDGDFAATMPPGTYLVVAQNANQTATSPIQRVTVTEGRRTVVSPVVPAPGRVRFQVSDSQGRLMPAKLSFIPILGEGDGARLAERDGLRRPFIGEGRYGDGVRYMVPTHTGEGTTEVEPGRYRVVMSHGPEYSIVERDINVASGQQVIITGALVHEVDTTGWIAGDFHLHAEGSFDSGMKLEERVRRCLIEGVEFAVATDHDILTDYAPAVRSLGVQDRIMTAVGVELSTLELGHFIAFPLKYDASQIPDHGAPDWTCLDGPGILAELTSKIEPGTRGVRIMAHPRDGFIGHISQHGLSPWDFGRELSFLEANNVLLSRTTCDFDAMEVLNSKRFDLIRTPTNEEVIRFNRCDAEIAAATTVAELDAACPDLTEGGPLASCPDGERFFECQQRYRRRMAFTVARDILIRTPEEQLAFWNHTPTPADEGLCDPEGTEPIDPATALGPCVHHIGTFDEWMRWLDAGLAVTITAASDSHANAREPGFPRTYVRNDAPIPGAIVPGEVAEAVVEGRALPTFGPFIEARIGGAEPGDIARVTGPTFDLDLRVQTASWYGVDRIEVYVSGLLEHIIELDHGPEPIVDFDGTITLPTPDRDGFVAVVALGFREENLLSPVSFEIAFGELQLPRILGLAFSALPTVSAFFDPEPIIPDYFPVFPIGITNAIFLDVDGDGEWRPSDDPPPLCELPCDPAADDPDTVCRRGEVCLPIGQCGIDIRTECRTGPPGTGARGPHLGH